MNFPQRRPSRSEAPGPDRNRVRESAWFAILLLGAPLAAAADPGSATSIFRPASSNALAIHRYSLFVLGITGAIFAVVFTMLVVAIVRFRRRPGDDAAEPPQVYGSEQVEVAWTAPC